MKISRLSALCVASALAACGGGGGGGGSSSGMSGGMASVPVPDVTIRRASAIDTTGAPRLATGTTPNFVSGLTIGTKFPLTQVLLSVGSQGAFPQSSDGQLTVSGLAPGGGPATYRLQADPVGLNNEADLPVDGTSVMNVPNSGGSLTLLQTWLTYTQIGFWIDKPGPITNPYFATTLIGFQTPGSGVPASGSATYSGSVMGGNVFVPDGAGGIKVGALQGGAAAVGVNFASGAVTGSLTGMSVAPSGGASAGWNNVTLAGTLSGATFKGTTTTPGASGSFGLSAAATGLVTGALYGPQGQELGAVWTLSEPNETNGKLAVGTFAAPKQ